MGSALESGKHYTWKVNVWDNQGSKPASSETAHFQTALFNPESEFTAKYFPRFSVRPY